MNAVRSATLVTALLLAARVRAAGMPAVAVAEAPGMTCPSTGAVRQALSRLRDPPGPGDAPTFRLFIAGTASQAHVDLRDGAGRSVLVRDIPAPANECERVADAIALIVERHFQAIDWSPPGASRDTEPPSWSPSPGARTAAPAPSVTMAPSTSSAPGLPSAPSAASAATTGAEVPRPPPRSPPGTPAAAPVEASAVPPAVGEPAPPVVKSSDRTHPDVAGAARARAVPPARPPLPRFAPAALPRLALGVGPAFWSRGATFAVAVGARWRVLADSPFEIGAGLLLPPLHASGAVGSGGSVHVSAVPVTASFGLASALGPLAAGAHVSGLWTIEHGESEAIPQPAAAWRTVFGVGLGLSGAWPLTTRLRFTLSLDGYRTVLGRSYAIAGVSGTVLDPAPWQTIVALGAEWVVSP